MLRWTTHYVRGFEKNDTRSSGNSIILEKSLMGMARHTYMYARRLMSHDAYMYRRI